MIFRKIVKKIMRIVKDWRDPSKQVEKETERLAGVSSYVGDANVAE